MGVNLYVNGLNKKSKMNNKKVLTEINRINELMGNKLLTETKVATTFITDFIQNLINVSNRTDIINTLTKIKNNPKSFNELLNVLPKLKGNAVAKDLIEKLQNNIVKKTSEHKYIKDALDRGLSGDKIINTMISRLKKKYPGIIDDKLKQRLTKEIRESINNINSSKGKVLPKPKPKGKTKGKTKDLTSKFDGISVSDAFRDGIADGWNYPNFIKILLNPNTKMGPEQIKGWRYLMRYILQQTPVNLDLKKTAQILIKHGFSSELAKQISYTIGQLGGNGFYRYMAIMIMVTIYKMIRERNASVEEYEKLKDENAVKLFVEKTWRNIEFDDNLTWFIPFYKTGTFSSLYFLKNAPWGIIAHQLITGEKTDLEKEYNETTNKISGESSSNIGDEGEQNVKSFSSDLFYEKYPCYKNVLDINYNQNGFKKGVKVVSPTDITIRFSDKKEYDAKLKGNTWHFTQGEEIPLTC